MQTFKIPKINSVLYWGIFIMNIKTFLVQSKIIPYPNSLDLFLTFLAVSCFVFSILQEHYTLKVLFIYVIITLLSLFSVFKTGNYGFLITILVCLSIREKNIEDILTFIFKYELLFLIIQIVISVSLFFFGYNILTLNMGGLTRYTFGFSHPNIFSLYFLNLIIMWSWLNYDRINGKHIFALIMISSTMFYFTKTRTSFITIIVFCIVLLIQKGNFSIKKIIKPIAKFITPLCALLSLFVSNLFISGNAFAIGLNSILVGRVKFGAYALDQYGLSFFGQDLTNYKIIWDQDWKINSFTFDNLYTYLAVNQGFIWIVLVSILFYFLVKKSDEKNYVFIILWALYGITEVHGLNGFKCFPIFLLVLLFKQKKSVIETRESS